MSGQNEILRQPRWTRDREPIAFRSLNGVPYSIRVIALPDGRQLLVAESRAVVEALMERLEGVLP